jgi:hypothetical protein
MIFEFQGSSTLPGQSPKSYGSFWDRRRSPVASHACSRHKRSTTFVLEWLQGVGLPLLEYSSRKRTPLNLF